MLNKPILLQHWTRPRQLAGPVQ